MKKVRVAVIGVGRMGTIHARNLKKGKVKGAVLCAICDIKNDATEAFCKKYGVVPTFADYKAMLSEIKPDAVIIATEHYFHVSIGKYCVEHGVATLIEKPLAVTTLDAKEFIECAAKHPETTACVMFNQRTNPMYRRAKQLVEDGVIGKITRINFIVTDWYRSQAYYNQGGWRASLWGEGGGTLINQCVHQLDLVQWICGMPQNVYVKMFTKGRDITTENDVTALMGYEGDVYLSFSASTHELRGTNRLEIAGDKGRIIIDKRKMTVYILKRSEPEVNKTTSFGYGFVTRKTKKYGYGVRLLRDLRLGQQRNIVQNFVNHIAFGEKLISPCADGLNAVELINGMYMSGWLNKTVDLPLNDNQYNELLTQKRNEEKIKLGRN